MTQPTEYEQALRMISDQHRATICDDFLIPSARHVECSCGWVGHSASVEHLALAEWAAHVHVAEGLAEEGAP
jgi:hypothetical protein